MLRSMISIVIHVPILWSAFFVLEVKASGEKPQTQLIKESIFVGYDKHVRPVRHENLTLSVRLNPALYSISQLDFIDQTLTLKIYMRHYWRDEFLAWDPAQFDGLSKIYVERSGIWLPDIFILDQTALTQLVKDKEYVVRLDSDGNVTTSFDEVVTIHCHYDVSNFPFDTQTCSMHLGSWMYTAVEIDIHPTLPTDLGSYNENGEWDLLNFTTHRSESVSDGVQYVDVYYDLTMRRRPQYYLTTFVWPSFIITCVCIIGIFAPFNAEGTREEKVTMGLTTLLTMAFVLNMVTAQMPRSSNGLSVLGLFVMLEIGISALASLVSVAVLFLHSQWVKGHSVPGWLLFIFCLKRRFIVPIVRADAGVQATEPVKFAKSSITGRISRTMANASDIFSLKSSGDFGLKSGQNSVAKKEHREKKPPHDVHDQWSAVSHRLDLVLMGVFLLINTAILVWTITGPKFIEGGNSTTSQ